MTAMANPDSGQNSMIASFKQQNIAYPVYSPQSLPDLGLSEQIQLFESLKNDYFSGQLIFSNDQQTQWRLHFYLGRIVFATGGIHPVRRWKRHLSLNFPEFLTNPPQILLKEFSQITEVATIGWEYQLLSLWKKRAILTSEQLSCIIRGIVSDVLFDLNQAQNITYELKAEKLSFSPLAVLNNQQIITQTWKDWQAWQGLPIANASPNLALIIKDKDALQQHTSPMTYELLTQRLSGEWSLRELSTYLNQNLVSITRALSVYLQWDALELVDIPDLPHPISNHFPQITPSSSYTIACIDPNPHFCDVVETMAQYRGHKVLSSYDGLTAIAFILSHKPDLIFISDQLKPINGFDICSQLRQISTFRHTPIIIVAESANMMEWMKGKMVGCSQIVSKPLNINKIEQIIDNCFGDNAVA